MGCSQSRPGDEASSKDNIPSRPVPENRQQMPSASRETIAENEPENEKLTEAGDQEPKEPGHLHSRKQDAGTTFAEAASHEQNVTIAKIAAGRESTETITARASHKEPDDASADVAEIARSRALAKGQRRQVETIEDELFERLEQHKVGEDGNEIILPEAVKAIWAPLYYRTFYTSQDWYDKSWDRTTIMDEYLRIMSILIYIEFGNWADFRAIFLNRDRTDQNLPFSLKILQGVDFLGKRSGRSFYDAQWMFCPDRIQERKGLYHMNGPRRLPWLDNPERIGEGAYGTVTMQTIAAGYLEYDNRTVNSKPKVVAIKSVSDKKASKVEFDNLQALRRCLSGHKRIMVNLATIVDESKKTGCVYHIVYELAAYDLNVFLTTLPLDQRKIRNETAGPERTDSKYMWPGDLILESRNLADALDYLHNRLYNTSSISLSHNDIRPENILVVYPDSTDVPDRYPVGKWKIADFGLSRVKPKRPPGSKHLCAEEAIPIPPKADITHRIERSVSVSKTVPKRDPGRYTAPELDQKKPMKTDGRNADLWAFGCVLSEIITYAVNLDCQLVEDFREVLGQPSRLDHRFYDHVTKDVKPQFFNHLDKLSQMAHGDDRTAYNSQWVDSCVDLVKNVVVANPKKRLGAGEIRDTLRDIDITMRGKKKLWLDTCLHIDTTNITVGSTYSPGLAMPSATESPTEIKELDLAKGDPLSRTPSIVVSSASSVETRSSVAAEERKRRKTLPR